MHHSETIADLRRRLADERRGGHSVALVATMGNLHAGHLQLVERALHEADCVVVSIYVNPLQFGAGEDLERYPRTLAEDSEKLEAAGAQVLFAPADPEIYPHGAARTTRVEVPDLSTILCGAARPGHFAGVATMVVKLFHIVQPDVALFGEKDWQQLQTVRRLTADLHLPVRIVGVPTVREADGLALSSRNGYLNAAERQRASQLCATLRWSVAQTREGGAAAIETVEQAGLERLRAAGFAPEYLAIRNAETLAPARAEDRALIALAAARLGRTRLIDNIPFTL